MVTSLESLLRNKWRQQEIILKPAFRKEKLQNCCVGMSAPDTENCLSSELQLLLTTVHVQKKKDQSMAHQPKIQHEPVTPTFPFARVAQAL
jgi:hypothetical protein